MQATPYDNLGHQMPPKEIIGLMTSPAGMITYTREATWAGAAKPYRFGLRHRFPKPIGLGA